MLVTLSDEWIWVRILLVQLLLSFARAVTVWSKSRRTHDRILLYHFRLTQPGGRGPRIYIPQEQGVKVKVTLRVTISQSVSIS
jgi:hypothetical protein